MARAENDDERKQLEMKMASDADLLPVLQALNAMETDDLVQVLRIQRRRENVASFFFLQEERARKAAQRKSKVESGLEAEDADQIKKKGV